MGEMEKESLLNEVKRILVRGGYQIGVPILRSMIFDIIARKDDRILIIKVLHNADSLRFEVAREMKILGHEFKASPMVIGVRSGTGPIMDGVVYSRHGIPVISLQTLYDIVIEGVNPMVYVAPGGFYVDLDGELLRDIREKRGISLGELARVAGVTRKTIQLYEEGMSSTVDVALKLEEFLRAELIKPIDVFTFADLSEERIASDEIMFQDIYRRLIEIGYDVFLTLKCPFEAISKDNRDLMLTGFEEKERRLRYKAQNIRIFSEILGKRGFIVVSDTRYEDYDGVAIIRKREIMRYDKDELKKVVEERSGI